MSTPGPRLAVNPIAYWLAAGTADKSTARLGAAMEELAGIGYTAVKADVPTDLSRSATSDGSRASVSPRPSASSPAPGPTPPRTERPPSGPAATPRSRPRSA